MNLPRCLTCRGLSAEALQEWGYIAEQSGGSIEDVADAAREMQLRLAEAAELGTGPAIDALEILGVSRSRSWMVSTPISNLLFCGIASRKWRILRSGCSWLRNCWGERRSGLPGLSQLRPGRDGPLTQKQLPTWGVQLTNEQEVAKLDAYDQKIAELGQRQPRIWVRDSLFVAAEALTTFGEGILQIGDFLGVDLAPSLLMKHGSGFLRRRRLGRKLRLLRGTWFLLPMG